MWKSIYSNIFHKIDQKFIKLLSLIFFHILDPWKDERISSNTINISNQELNIDQTNQTFVLTFRKAGSCTPLLGFHSENRELISRIQRIAQRIVWMECRWLPWSWNTCLCSFFYNRPCINYSWVLTIFHVGRCLTALRQMLTALTLEQI